MACTVILEIQLKADAIDTAKGAFKEILPDTRAYDGCQGVEVTENQDKAGNIVLVEKWDSREKYEKMRDIAAIPITEVVSVETED